MKRTLQGLLVLTLAVVLAMPAAAAEDKKKKKKKKGRRAPAAVRVTKGIELTADQKKQVAAINKEFAPKLLELNKKAGTIITPEQRKARSVAFKKAKADGKKGKEARAAVNAAVNLSAEQKKALAEVNKARQVIFTAARAKFVEILTDEQKAKLPKKKGKKKKKKKKADA
jgi:Spy/CpxP family protein refolding chaperone